MTEPLCPVRPATTPVNRTTLSGTVAQREICFGLHVDWFQQSHRAANTAQCTCVRSIVCQFHKVAFHKIMHLIEPRSAIGSGGQVAPRVRRAVIGASTGALNLYRLIGINRIASPLRMASARHLFVYHWAPLSCRLPNLTFTMHASCTVI